MTYSSDTPTEPGFYLARGFRLRDGEREEQAPTWEYPLWVFRHQSEPVRLMFTMPGHRNAEFVDQIGIYPASNLGPEVKAYDVEWARIPTPAEPAPATPTREGGTR